MSSSRATSAGAAPATGMSNLPPLPPKVGGHRLTVTTVPAHFTDEVYRLYRNYQIVVHGEEPSEVTPQQFERFLVDSPLIREGQEGAGEKRPGGGDGSRALRHGRATKDNKAAGKAGSRAIECVPSTEGEASLSVPYGSYHQLYRIGTRLIAVGVVDILPKCVSSVYCFYDLDYRPLAPGKLTALYEIDFVLKVWSCLSLVRL
ncbi:unnamed protein product [Discosporangium mesarthrocarpum]